MAVLIEAESVDERLDAIEKKAPGGWKLIHRCLTLLLGPACSAIGIPLSRSKLPWAYRSNASKRMQSAAG